jgi:hypothetical protein
MPHLRLPTTVIARELVYKDDRPARACLLVVQPNTIVAGCVCQDIVPLEEFYRMAGLSMPALDAAHSRRVRGRGDYNADAWAGMFRHVAGRQQVVPEAASVRCSNIVRMRRVFWGALVVERTKLGYAGTQFLHMDSNRSSRAVAL